MPLLQELKRRNVFRVAAAYLVAAWLLIEVSATLEETLHLPDWADSLLAYFLILGFPIALFFSWAYEITPDGIRREKDLDEERSSRAATARKLDWAVIVMLSLAMVFFVADRFGAEQTNLAPAETPTASNLSIAVLPFVNMSPDADQEYFSDGLTEELLNLLAGIPELKVAARTSSFFYKDKLDDVPLTDIARQLDVAHVLEGSVRRDGNQLRVTAQLIQADNGFHLWSRTYDRSMDSVFALQDEIAAAVARELQITLLGQAPKAKVIDTESWELTLQGRFFYNRRQPGDIDRALQAFERAVELDPDNALAWVGLSPLYYAFQEPPDVEKGRLALEKSLAIDPGNVEAHLRLSGIYERADNLEMERLHFEKARELGPNTPIFLTFEAFERAEVGDLEGAIDLQKRAVEEDPLHLVNLSNLASLQLRAAQFEDVLETTEKMEEISPGHPFRNQYLAEVSLFQGHPRKALENIGVMPDSKDRAFLIAAAHFSAGNTELANQLLAEFENQYGQQSPDYMAYLHGWRGELDLAFEWIGKIHDVNPFLDPYFNMNIWADTLKKDPRWEALKSSAE